jgi:hypothetical protein
LESAVPVGYDKQEELVEAYAQCLALCSVGSAWPPYIDDQRITMRDIASQQDRPTGWADGIGLSGYAVAKAAAAAASSSISSNDRCGEANTCLCPLLLHENTRAELGCTLDLIDNVYSTYIVALVPISEEKARMHRYRPRRRLR